MTEPFAWVREDGYEGYELTQQGDGLDFPVYKHNPVEYVLYGYATPSGKIYPTAFAAIQNGEQKLIKVYVNKEDL